MGKAIFVLLAATVAVLAVTSVGSADRVPKPFPVKPAEKTIGEEPLCMPKGDAFCGSNEDCCTNWCRAIVYMGGILTYCERVGCVPVGGICTGDNGCCGFDPWCDKKENATVGVCH